tara:strand:+ start:327 stop:605 length:279 start_codon:yes stop_codon:yes gene_type:complete
MPLVDIHNNLYNNDTTTEESKMSAIKFAVNQMPNKRQSELAHLIGYKLQRVQWWMAQDIPDNQIFKVAKAIGVSPKVLHTMKFQARQDKLAE